MTNSMAKTLVALALLAGCGSNPLRDTDGATTPADDTVAGTAQGLSVDVRMRAIGAEQFSSLQLLADQVRVTVDGVALPVHLVGDVVDLANMGHAARLANFTLPDGAQMVEIAVELAPAGVYDDPSGSGVVLAPGTVLRFKSSAENLAAKNKAVIELDAVKSLVVTDVSTIRMVPKFRVEY